MQIGTHQTHKLDRHLAQVEHHATRKCGRARYRNLPGDSFENYDIIKIGLQVEHSESLFITLHLIVSSLRGSVADYHLERRAQLLSKEKTNFLM